MPSTQTNNNTDYNSTIDQIISLIAKLPHEVQVELFNMLDEQFSSVMSNTDEEWMSDEDANNQIASYMASKVA